MDGSCQFDRLIEVQFVYETYAVRPLNPKKYRQKIISPQILLENLKLFFLRKIKMAKLTSILGWYLTKLKLWQGGQCWL